MAEVVEEEIVVEEQAEVEPQAVNVDRTSGTVDSNFILPGLRVGQVPLPIVLAKFNTVDTVESNLPASVAAKDLPYLTLNDKIFAVRNDPPVTWTATGFGAGQYVSYQGKIYYANATCVAGDVPGASAKWSLTTSYLI